TDEQSLAKLDEMFPEGHPGIARAPLPERGHGAYGLVDESGDDGRSSGDASVSSAGCLISLLKIFMDWPRVRANAGRFGAPNNSRMMTSRMTACHPVRF